MALHESATEPDGIHQRVAAMRDGRTSAVALLDAARARAEQNAALNAIAHADWERAGAIAHERDREVRAARLRGPLHGIPITIKDLFAVRDMPIAAGTRAVLPELRHEAAAVERLREAGAVIFAKTNMHEIALGATGENSWTGDVLNPYDAARQAGGSSSGAGVCVARGIGDIGLGSDTGGSIRIPANFCGVVGFKPSFGAVPLAGGLHLSWTCDHGGPLTRSVADARIAFEVLAQRSTAHGAVPRPARFAVPTAWLAPRMDDAVRDRFEQALAALRAAGAVLHDVDLPALDWAWQCYTPIVRAEAAWVHREAVAAGGKGFSQAVLAPLQAGSTATAAQYFDAMAMRDRVRAQLDEAARGVDAILLPTAPVLPPLRGQTDVHVASGRMSVRQAVLGQTLPFNLAGMPALTLPMGNAPGPSGPLPTGLQLVGRIDSDARLLALGAWVEELLADARA